MKIINYTSQNSTTTLCLVTGIHGNEAFLFEPLKLFLDTHSFNINIKLILANELAAQENKRYIDHDLNRIFNHKNKNGNEATLVHLLKKEVNGDLIIDFHSHTSAEQFALISKENDSLYLQALINFLQLPHCIIIPLSLTNKSSLIENTASSLSIETGKHQSQDAITFAINSVEKMIHFLTNSQNQTNFLKTIPLNHTQILYAEKFLINSSKQEISIPSTFKNFQPIPTRTKLTSQITLSQDCIPALISYHVKPNQKIMLICKQTN